MKLRASVGSAACRIDNTNEIYYTLELEMLDDSGKRVRLFVLRTSENSYPGNDMAIEILSRVSKAINAV